MADWPQWRGPRRDGISAETGWNASWTASGPRRLWKAAVGGGFSSVAVADGRLYTIGNEGGQDVVVCFQADSGKPLWRQRYRCDPGDQGGPRATPTVHAGGVYTLSREGLALRLEAGTGKVVWRRELAREMKVAAPGWGFCGSPLIQGNRAFYNVGGGAALDLGTGRVVWSRPGITGYASPVGFAAGGRSGIAIFAGDGLVAVNPRNGQALWNHPWKTNYDVNAADPIFSGDAVFISSNYGHGAALLRVGAGKPRPVWENRNMRNHFCTSVLLDGALYGNDENTLECVDLRTGEERWQMRGMGKGGLIAAEGKLLVLTERGELLAVRATPTKFTELARASVLDGTCWTIPAMANGRLYCRNHEGTLVCLDLRR